MFEVNHEKGLLLSEIADGVSVEDVKAATGCGFQVHVVFSSHYTLCVVRCCVQGDLVVTVHPGYVKEVADVIEGEGYSGVMSDTYYIILFCVVTVITVNAEILACRKLGDFVQNRVGLNSGKFLIWHLCMAGHCVRSHSLNVGGF